MSCGYAFPTEVKSRDGFNGATSILYSGVICSNSSWRNNLRPTNFVIFLCTFCRQQGLNLGKLFKIFQNFYSHFNPCHHWCFDTAK